MTFIFTNTYLAKHYFRRAAAINMAVTLLMFVTFLTDNTLEKYCPQIAWHLLPLALAMEEETRKIAKLREKPLLSKERTSIWPEKKGMLPLTVQQTLSTQASTEDPVAALRRYRMQRRESR